MNTDFADGWSLAHVSWGMIIHYVLSAVVPSSRSYAYLHLIIVIAIGAAWELIENNKWVQSQFRKYGFPDYYGDSTRNMVGDQLFFAGGYFMAWLGPKWFVVLPMLLEVLMYLLMGDNTLITVVRFLKK